MKKSLATLILCFLIIYSFSVNYYVSPTGSDANAGTTPEKPLVNLATAISKAAAGDTIWMRGGTHAYSNTITISKSGSTSKKYYLKAWPGEQPLLDFSATSSGKKGISLTGSYWMIKGLTITQAGDNGMAISGGGYNQIENCTFYENEDTGMQLDNGAHDNRIINCDSYYNADPPDHGDADGFAPKLTVGSNNYFYGCRAWGNCDDGWDGYMRGATNVTTKLENCWTWGNGYLKDGSDPGSQANGNGFKMGGGDNSNSDNLTHHFILTNCLAFNNKAKGFDQNNNVGSMTLINCSGFGNLTANYRITRTLLMGQNLIVKNCLSHNGKVELGSFAIQANNSWSGGFTVSDGDFLSVDPSGMDDPRKADGSLPDLAFMHLAPGSDLINAGMDVGLPYKGTKPDLGCFESEETLGIELPVKLETNVFDLKIKAIGANLEISFVPGDEVDFSAGLTNLTGTLVWTSGDFISDAQRKKVIVPRNGHAPGIYLFHLSDGKKKAAMKFRLP